MEIKYKDLSKNISLLFIRNVLGKVRYLPFRGTIRLTGFLADLLPKPKPQEPCIVETLHEFKLIVDPALDHKGIEKFVYLHGSYEEGTLSILKSFLSEGGCFVDVGANIGLMSLHASKILGNSGKVFSFEPLQSTFEILAKNISLNHFKNITAENCAIGSEIGTVTIYENLSKNRGSSSLINPKTSEASHQVPITRLDDYIVENEVGTIKCLKIDVEGWEYEVLKGAEETLSRDDAPICILESSKILESAGGDSVETYSFIRDLNDYKIYKLKETKEKPSKLIEILSSEDLPLHDNIFCLLSKHIAELPKNIFSD